MTSRSWVVLTMGDRPAEVATALNSIKAADPDAHVLLLVNAAAPAGEPNLPDGVEVIHAGENLGVPGGRDFAVARCDTDVVAFLDDDAELLTSVTSELLDRAFEDPNVGATTFRLHDAAGTTARRHNPRPGRTGSDQAGSVPTFLGGACAIRRSAYVDVGGYWPTLFYAHEELDLSWRLLDGGYDVIYEPRISVYHPATPISRHADGWRLTGRNRVLVARRNLPVPILLAHVLIWLVGGVVRAPDWSCRRSYIGGWLQGWRIRDVPRRAIRWRTVVRLARIGRPPVI